MKEFLHTLITKDHIESLVHKGLMFVGSWMVSSGMLTAGGIEQFATGGAAIVASLVLNFIASHEKKQADATAKVPILSPLTTSGYIQTLSGQQEPSNQLIKNQ